MLAFQTGHLTPASLLLELNKLFERCPVFVIHIKALEYDAAVAGIDRCRAKGLNLVVPQQGENYRF